MAFCVSLLYACEVCQVEEMPRNDIKGRIIMSKNTNASTIVTTNVFDGKTRRLAFGLVIVVGIVLAAALSGCGSSVTADGDTTASSATATTNATYAEGDVINEVGVTNVTVSSEHSGYGSRGIYVFSLADYEIFTVTTDAVYVVRSTDATSATLQKVATASTGNKVDDSWERPHDGLFNLVLVIPEDYEAL